VGGLVLVVMGTGANVLLAVLYNLISDVVGGIIVVFEERPTRRRSRSPAPFGGDGDGTDGGQPLAPLKPARAARRRLLPPPRTGPDTTPMPDLPEERPVQVQAEQVEPAELSRRPSD
jgi:hypothetical protein